MEKLKKVFGAIWKWLKANWLVVVVVVVILGVIVLAANAFSQDESYRRLFQQYTEQAADYHRQIKDLRLLQEQERAEQERIMQEYIVELYRIEREYKTELERIAEQRSSTQDVIIRNFERDPTTLTNAVHTVFGIPVE